MTSCGYAPASRAGSPPAHGPGLVELLLLPGTRSLPVAQPGAEPAPGSDRTRPSDVGRSRMTAVWIDSCSSTRRPSTMASAISRRAACSVLSARRRACDRCCSATARADLVSNRHETGPRTRRNRSRTDSASSKARPTRVAKDSRRPGAHALDHPSARAGGLRAGPPPSLVPGSCRAEHPPPRTETAGDPSPAAHRRCAGCRCSATDPCRGTGGWFSGGCCLHRGRGRGPDVVEGVQLDTESLGGLVVSCRDGV